MADEPIKKDFWSTKEGTWGLGIAVLAIAALVFFKGAILAGVTVLMMTLGTGIAYGILCALALLLIHGLFIDGWLMLRYQVFCKKMRQMIVDESPLTILKMWKDKAMERMKEIRSGKDNVKKQEVAINADCTEFKNDFTQFQKRAAALEGRPDQTREFNSAAGNMMKAAEMLKKSVERLHMVQTQYKRIDDAYKDLEVMYKDMEYEEKCITRDDSTSNALDKVWTSIRSIFKGEDEWDQLRKDAVDSLNNKYATRMGRVESAINDCQGRFDEIKLDREIKETDGVIMFNQLKGVSVEQLMSSVTAPAATASISYQPSESIAVPVGTRSYADLLKK
jgi:hypothetical protein